MVHPAARVLYHALMPDELAFLDAIRAAPRDDAPRLIYADWLSEQGDPAKQAFGEFIRLQMTRCAAAMHEGARPAERMARRGSRERELYTNFARAWEQPLVALGVSVTEYDRGLPSELRTSPDALIDHAPQITELAPAWKSLYLHGYGERFRRAVATSLPTSVAHFRFRFNDEGVTTAAANARDLAASPWLRQAASLSLEENRLAASIEPIIAAASQTPTLRSLNLAANEIDSATASVLAEYSCFQRLEELDVSQNSLGDGFAAILTACRPDSLRYLQASLVDGPTEWPSLQWRRRSTAHPTSTVTSRGARANTSEMEALIRAPIAGSLERPHARVLLPWRAQPVVSNAWCFLEAT